MKCTVERFARAPAGTYGQMVLPDGKILYTVERPWANNAPGVSCIPAGSYRCAPRPFYAGNYDAVEILDVPNRSYILFHVANVPTDVKGCIGIGSDLGWVKGQWAVTASRRAFAEFMRHYNCEFDLDIKWACNG